AGCGLQRVYARQEPFKSDGSTTVSVPAVCFVSTVSGSSPGGYNGPGRSYPPSGRHGVHATADCYGRTFVREEIANADLRKRASALALAVEFIGKDGEVIQTVHNGIPKFPELPTPESYIDPRDRTDSASIDYCGAGTNEDRIFFATTQHVGGDVIIVPPE